MKISIKKSHNLACMDITAENEAETYQLEEIKRACESAAVTHGESRK